MSKATKRKHVTREVLEGDVRLADGQSIVRVSMCITKVQCNSDLDLLHVYHDRVVLFNINFTALFLISPLKVVCGRGNNLHEVESATGVKFLVSMPTKFRRNVWIKRGRLIILRAFSTFSVHHSQPHTPRF